MKSGWDAVRGSRFSRGRGTEQDVCGSHSQTSGASAMPAGIQEGTPTRQDHQALIKPRETEPAYNSPRLCSNSAPQFHFRGHQGTGCPPTGQDQWGWERDHPDGRAWSARVRAYTTHHIPRGCPAEQQGEGAGRLTFLTKICYTAN